MKLFTQFWQTWSQDRLLRRIARNTGYLFSSNTVSMVLSSAGGILSAYLLGAADYGVLGMIVLFASSVNRLLSFRMGEMVIRYAGQDLAVGQKDKAAALIKAAGVAEALTSVVAYALLVLLAPLAARWLIKDPRASGWIIFYGLALVANLMTETSTAVLQLGNHYRSQAALTLAQSILTMALIGAAYWMGGGVLSILTAYLVGKLVFGVGIMAAALRWLRPMLGDDWLRAPLTLIKDWRGILRFSISTNLSGTINMIIRDSEVLWVGLFFTKLEAGYYKFALAMMNLLLMPITPFITTTFPEISRSVARRDWHLLRNMLKRTTLISASWTAACVAGLLLLGGWVFGWFKGGEYLPSLPIIFVLLAGYGTANIFFWNRPLLLAFGKPNYPLVVTALVGLAKTALMFVLVRPFGYLAQAGLLSAYFMVSVGLIVLRGLRELRRAEAEMQG